MNVLIAVDDTDTSIDAVHTARHLFGDNANDTVVSIGEPNSVLAAYDPNGLAAFDIETLEATDATRAAQRATDAVRRSGLERADVIAEVGLPGPQLCDVAERINADAIVIGYQPRGWLNSSRR